MLPRKSLCQFLVLLLGLSSLLVAQANPGDIIVANSNKPYLLKVDPLGAVATFAMPGVNAQSITEEVVNQGVLIASSSSPGDLVQVSLDGTATTLLTGGPLIVDLDVDGEGNYVGVGFPPGGMKANAVFTISSTGSLTTLFLTSTIIGKVYAMGLDTLSGDVVVVDGANKILRITRDATPVVTTVLGSMPATGGNASIHPEFSGAEQLLGYWNKTVHRLTLGVPNPLSTLVSGAPFVWPGDVEYDSGTGLYLLADMGSSQGSIYKFDSATSAITTVVNMTGQRPFMLAVAGGRNLCATNPARIAQTLQLKVSMPQEGGNFYVTALSFGYAPGFTLPGGLKVYLNVDPLFALSLSNAGIFSNFQGILNAQGIGAPAVAIPNVPLLAGFRFFGSAVAFHGAVPARVSEPVGFTIRP